MEQMVKEENQECKVKRGPQGPNGPQARDEPNSECGEKGQPER